jgi:hypothetical protein
MTAASSAYDFYSFFSLFSLPPLLVFLFILELISEDTLSTANLRIASASLAPW